MCEETTENVKNDNEVQIKRYSIGELVKMI